MPNKGNKDSLVYSISFSFFFNLFYWFSVEMRLKAINYNKHNKGKLSFYSYIHECLLKMMKDSNNKVSLCTSPVSQRAPASDSAQAFSFYSWLCMMSWRGDILLIVRTKEVQGSLKDK